MSKLIDLIKNFDEFLSENSRDAILSDIKDLLKKSPELIEIQDNDGNSVLHIAAYYGFAKIAKLLLETSLSKDLINLQNLDKETALHIAAVGCIDMVKLLLENGAKNSINLPNLNGYTVLHIAASEENLAIVELLFKHGAKDTINLQNSDGNTALHIASTYGRFEIVKALLEQKADRNIKNKFGKTASDIKCHKMFENMTALFKKYENRDLVQIVTNNINLFSPQIECNSGSKNNAKRHI